MTDLCGMERSPVAVRLLRPGEEESSVPAYQGVSYCDAVRRAGEGEMLRVVEGSIEVCGWSPAVLGLKAPATRFERRLEPRLPFPGGGLLLAPLTAFPREPDLVVIRASAAQIGRLLAAAGPGGLWTGHGGRLERSAAFLFDGEGGLRRPRLVEPVNRVLAGLAGVPAWQALTRWLFRSHLVTAGLEAFISRTLADMSVCRNSTAIPLLSGQANVSFFCTGGITWGRNDPAHLTSGWPYPLFRRAVGVLQGDRAAGTVAGRRST